MRVVPCPWGRSLCLTYTMLGSAFFFPPARQVEMGTGHKATEQGAYPQPRSLTLQQHITGGSPRMCQAPSCGAVTSRNLLLGPNSLVVGLEGHVK